MHFEFMVPAHFSFLPKQMSVGHMRRLYCNNPIILTYEAADELHPGCLKDCTFPYVRFWLCDLWWMTHLSVPPPSEAYLMRAPEVAALSLWNSLPRVLGWHPPTCSFASKPSPYYFGRPLQLVAEEGAFLPDECFRVLSDIS